MRQQYAHICEEDRASRRSALSKQRRFRSPPCSSTNFAPKRREARGIVFQAWDAVVRLIADGMALTDINGLVAQRGF